MSTGEEIRVGDHVRVKPDCPHTLPAYARVLVGQVLGPAEKGALRIQFGDDHVFPVATRWLERVPAPFED